MSARGLQRVTVLLELKGLRKKVRALVETADRFFGIKIPFAQSA